MESFGPFFPAVVPEIALAFLSVVILFLDLRLKESQRGTIAYVAAFGMLATAITPFAFAPNGEQYWGGMIRHDVLAQVFKVVVIIAGALTCLIAAGTRDLGRKGEFYLIIVVSTLGACLLSASADLIMIFIALETVSIPLYILASVKKSDNKSVESGMKYFLFGSFASAIMLYGFSLLYGFTNQTNIYLIQEALANPELGVGAAPVLVSIVLIIVGFGFKISAVPFHFWTPDVYEGAPTPVTAFVSVASKAASFAVVVRFFSAAFPQSLVIDQTVIQQFWIAFMAAAAVISMIVGNVLALSQKNIKRLLAYSSIAQAGYTLIGVAAMQSQSAQGVASVTFYLIMYTFTNLLAFAVVAAFAEQTGTENIADLAGLNRRNPWMALAMTVGLLSLGGIPPAAGFFGKFFLFNAAVEAGLVWLAIVGVLNAIVALYYYLVVIKVIYVDRSADEDKPINVAPAYAWVLGITTIAVILLGVIPTAIYNWALMGASSLLG